MSRGPSPRAKVEQRAWRASSSEWGVSAGGLQAFRAFFKAMPTDSGMAFVLVQHLDPGHASALAEIIGASTTMPVEQAKTGDVLAPNRVFVIPPDSILTNVGDRGRRQPAGAAPDPCAAGEGDVARRRGAEKTLVRML
ncbi:MAG: chemotaxis protein CheB [Caulobacteraceae bacterium]